jgi:hypothetical protein
MLSRNTVNVADTNGGHLLRQTQRIRLSVQSNVASQEEASSIKGSRTSPDVSACAVTVLQDTETDQQVAFQGVLTLRIETLKNALKHSCPCT